jgi:putative sterol carrier protein
MPTVAEIFEKMPQRLDVSKAGNLNMAVLFDLSGPEGGQWTVEVANGECQVHTEAVGTPTATIRMAADDYVAMTSGTLNPMTAFMTGKIKVEGDLGAVMKIQSLFGL